MYLQPVMETVPQGQQEHFMTAKQQSVTSSTISNAGVRRNIKDSPQDANPSFAVKLQDRTEICKEIQK